MTEEKKEESVVSVDAKPSSVDPLSTPSTVNDEEKDNVNPSSNQNDGDKESSTGDTKDRSKRSNGRRRFKSSLETVFSDEGDGCCAKLKRGEGRCGSCMFRWPRTCACCCGVVIPLLLLILISLIFGYSLCTFEAPNEIIVNDDIMQAQTVANTVLTLTREFARTVPRVCYGLFLEARPATDVQQEIDKIFDGWDNSTDTGGYVPSSVVEAYLSGDALLINTTQLFDFMIACGEASLPIADRLNEILRQTVGVAALELSFNWIRCIPGAMGLEGAVGFNARADLDSMQYSDQEAHYRATWSADQDEIFNQTYTYLLDEGYTPFDAKLAAFEISTEKATGETGCALNPAASTWFWFTVMTTIGYGNQAPETPGGRGFIYSFGFLSILCFGGILAVAGYIVSSVSDDASHRLRLHFLVRPWISSLIWAFLYYTWMILIAGYTLEWKKQRLDVTNEEFDFADSYWFAYISTTTVGLGDYFLEPEVIVWHDLITFPLMFLVGFTFLSSFLGKFSAALWQTFVGEGRTSYIEILVSQLQKTALVPDNLAVQEVEKVASDVGLKPFTPSDDDEFDEQIEKDEVVDEKCDEQIEDDEAVDRK